MNLMIKFIVKFSFFDDVFIIGIVLVSAEIFC